MLPRDTFNTSEIEAYNMRLRCPNCGEVIDRHNINIENTIAVCEACGEVFNFEGMVRGRKPKEREQPEGVHVIETTDAVMVEIPLLSIPPLMRTLTTVGYLLIIVAAVLFGFLVMARARFNPLAVILALLPTLPLVYYALAGLFNTLHITLNQTILRVQQHPLPVVTGRSFNRDRIIRFVVLANAGKGDFQHDIEARLSDGTRTILVRNLSEEDAVYVMETLNQFLEEEGFDNSTTHLSDEELPRLRRLQ
jgi:predicted RNA-binding Zn-ribbon protein involved in translation (DUF1610 family)